MRRICNLVGQLTKCLCQRSFVFNHSIGIDVFELLDAEGTKFQVLNMICLGTCFQLAEIVRQGSGTPSSAKCLDALKRRWMTWAGHPTNYPLRPWIAQPRHIGELDGRPWCFKCIMHHWRHRKAIGRVERHGGVLKGMARKVVAQTQAVGWGRPSVCGGMSVCTTKKPLT